MKIYKKVSHDDLESKVMIKISRVEETGDSLRQENIKPKSKRSYYTHKCYKRDLKLRYPEPCQDSSSEGLENKIYKRDAI